MYAYALKTKGKATRLGRLAMDGQRADAEAQATTAYMASSEGGEDNDIIVLAPTDNSAKSFLNKMRQWDHKADHEAAAPQGAASSHG
jgi:hypothetical protein